MNATSFLVGVAMLLLPAVTALAVAASLRLHSLVSTALAAYVVFVGEAAGLMALLSPFRLVTRGWVAIAETIALCLAAGVWHRRGRPVPAFARLRALRDLVAADPIVAILFLGVGVSLVYELVLVLTVPANNWDSLTYHLTRVAAWMQHDGIYWVPNAPTERINEFQPLAEQEILFVFVSTGGRALFALPQFLAELAAITAVFGGARRIGFDLRSSTCAALLFATLPLVALESTTSQNDLVAASLVVVAAVLLLGAVSGEVPVAGIAAGLALGVKLTAALALPVVLLLVLARGRRQLVAFTASAAAALGLVAGWSFVLNIAHTGHVLGHGEGRVEFQASPSLTGTPATIFRVLYRLFDLAAIPFPLVAAFAFVGLVLGLINLLDRRRDENDRANLPSRALALPLLAPLFVLLAARVARLGADAVALPVNSHATTVERFSWYVSNHPDEDLSAFGPLGGLALIAVPIVDLGKALRSRTWRRATTLALALPLFIVLLGLSSKYDPWLSRFLIIPAALTAPLFAALFRTRWTSVGIVTVALTGLVFVHAWNGLKPLDGKLGFPWQLTESQALERTFQPRSGAAYAALEAKVAHDSCLGAILGADAPSYLVYGPGLNRKVVFLPKTGAVAAASASRLSAVVVGRIPGMAAAFAARGWTLEPLPAPPGRAYWTLAVAPTTTACD